jgi:hypothetical protein
VMLVYVKSTLISSCLSCLFVLLLYPFKWYIKRLYLELWEKLIPTKIL